MRFKIITRDEAFDHLQRGDGEVCIVNTITDDTPIGALRNAEGFLLGIQEEPQPAYTEKELTEMVTKSINDNKRTDMAMAGTTAPVGKQDQEPTPEPKQKAQLPPRKPRIDQGKVMALHRAGWNVSSIAMEVGCSGQSVRNIIQKHESVDEESK